MLATMATVTTGLLSPNSYGLNTDQVAAKMSSDSGELGEYERYRSASSVFGRASSTGATSAPPAALNSSDSEPDRSKNSETPKRNKRKNFKPRCSSSALLLLPNFSDNNNRTRRRKQLPPTRKLVEDRFSPIDLSKANDSESSAGSDASDDYQRFAIAHEDDDDEEDTDDNCNRLEAAESRIPSSFSIRNLSKSHCNEFGAPSGLGQGQVCDMREYAVNTMRELLGIYGLTSEVAESITRQLPIAAFSSGKILENLSLGSQKSDDHSPPSQPPTPPSTPLSPKSHELNKYTSSIPTIPNLTITQASSPSLPQNLSNKSGQKTPLNLGKKHAGNKHLQQQQQQEYSNGSGLNLSISSDYPYQLDLELLRSKMVKEKGSTEKNYNNTRGIFPSNLLHFSGMKSEDDSPPPMDTNPLTAMMAQSLAPTQQQHHRDSSQSNLLITKTQSQMDYSKYVKKFSSSLECGSSYCKDLNYREHFHCLDCNSRVFIKKEEMIRHFKWHKKRDESLQHGFMRYSPLDDCSERYTNCTHNKKQTHYHCIKEGCDKVYISTSDVQMHANYHRKDSAIIQEGFQRYRATEECGASYCAFFGQRTTHFHCRRAGCRFTFKNKSDMEKHKSYHIKDEQLSRDGFKKFMKNESCPYENCRFSKVCNHIHCIRPQCNYVLHSSGQLFSHKRKHERKDSELAYRKYKLAQSMMKTLQDGGSSGPFDQSTFEMAAFHQGSNLSNSETLSERNSPVSYEESESASAIDLTAFPEDANWNGEDFWRKYCQHYGAQDHCLDKCELGYTDHYHCLVDLCNMIFNCKDGVREHARNHEQQEQVTDSYFTTVIAQNGGCDDGCIYQDKEKHFHCNWDNCREVILPTDKPFRRLEHYKMHEYSRKLSLTKDPLTMTHLATSIDGMFCRKRGRPPKNRVIEVWNDCSPIGSQSLMDSPQAIFTSFKLPKPSTSTPSSSKDAEQPDSNDDRSNSPTTSIQDYGLQGFDVYNENAKCADSLCPYLGSVHYHCNQDRCLYVTDKEDVLIMHSKDFHDNIDILDGFEFYHRNVDCRLSKCPSNKINRHYHCTRPHCNYSFVQYSTMALHNQKHVEDADVQVKTEAEPSHESTNSDTLHQFRAINLCQQQQQHVTDNKVSVVKASGTFYPLSTIPTEQHSPENAKNISEPSDAASSNVLYGPELSCSRPFCKLKRKPHYHCHACNQAFSELDRLVAHVAKHSTGALQSGQQVLEDNNDQRYQNGSPKPHLVGGVKTEPKINVAPLQSLQNPPTATATGLQKQQQQQQQELESGPYLTSGPFDAYGHFASFPANLATQFALMSQQQSMQSAFLPQSLYQNAAAAGLSAQLMFQHSGLMQGPLATYSPENLTSPLAAMAANLNKRALSPHEITPEAKKARLQNSMRILKDEPVPEGYLRFRFNEDCQYQHCGYREHQTHFHCQRQDCGYSFCDKTRFVQHTARHERLDTLMGGDFQQYRANVSCGRTDCAYTTNLGSTQNKASHFHCLKCEFVCTDTNKVVAHRRQHQKLDSIQAAGFEKFTPSQHCRAPNCQHSGKQTHYHCLSCQYAVLGLAQMSAHKYRHMEG